jgi:hypothetical protein
VEGGVGVREQFLQLGDALNDKKNLFGRQIDRRQADRNALNWMPQHLEKPCGAALTNSSTQSVPSKSVVYMATWGTKYLKGEHLRRRLPLCAQSHANAS